MYKTALPGNPRYQPKGLVPILDYDKLMAPIGEVEIASLEVLAEIGVIPKEDIALLTPELKQQILAITTSEVDEIERNITKHDIRAWVRRAQEITGPKLGRWLHVLLTSYDPISTAHALLFTRSYEQAIKPALCEVIGLFQEKVRRYAGTLQIGRTHGQHALPITVGFWLATILQRICGNLMELDFYADRLVGKISGAVGAYNAQVGLGITELCGEKSFEERVLAKVGLRPAEISTQILPPEPIARFLFSALLLSGSLAQFGRDCRHLMRTEIGEIGEPFEAGQVGSSTMAHKRNPINFEQLEGMFLRSKSELGKVLDGLLSEHQRDLVGSSLMRDFPIIIVNLMIQLNTLLRRDKQGVPFFKRIAVDEASCQRNFAMSEGVILAEPLYIALQMAGYEGDAHKLVNERAMVVAREKDLPLLKALTLIATEDEKAHSALVRIPPEVMALLSSPERYTGQAEQKALEVTQTAEQVLTLLA